MANISISQQFFPYLEKIYPCPICSNWGSGKPRQLGSPALFAVQVSLNSEVALYSICYIWESKRRNCACTFCNFRQLTKSFLKHHYVTAQKTDAMYRVYSTDRTGSFEQTVAVFWRDPIPCIQSLGTFLKWLILFFRFQSTTTSHPTRTQNSLNLCPALQVLASFVQNKYQKTLQAVSRSGY